MYYGYGMGGFFWDPTYILVIIGVVICLIASARVKSTYAKFEKVRSHSGVTAAEAAQQILHGAGIYNVRIEHISGHLTDNYDPRSKVLHLSDATWRSTSVAAIGVAAHECGHAIQDARDYAPLRIRGAIVPVVNFGSALSWPIIIIGVLLSFNHFLITLGIVLFSLTVVFQLVTLPVEFDASSRALRILGDTHMLYEDELRGGSGGVHDLAAFTTGSAVWKKRRLIHIGWREGAGSICLRLFVSAPEQKSEEEGEKMQGIKILCVGKVKETYFRDGIAHFITQIRKKCPVEIIECADEPTPDGASEAEEDKIRRTEGERLLQKIGDGDYVVALCIDGAHYASDAWKERMQKRSRQTAGALVFVIGGSLGLSDAVVHRANEKLSFSAMTFPHQMMRMILCEQLAEVFAD